MQSVGGREHNGGEIRNPEREPLLQDVGERSSEVCKINDILSISLIIATFIKIAHRRLCSTFKSNLGRVESFCSRNLIRAQDRV